MLLTTALTPATTWSAEELLGPFIGRPVAEILDEIRKNGDPIAYSSRLVTPEMLATVEPTANYGLGIAQEILRPHNLTLVRESGIFLVVRDTAATTSASSIPQPLTIEDDELETITVSASRYEISRDISTSQHLMDQRSIQSMPDLGEDPIRITHRLPGAAASGASARTHFRGGEQGEVGIVLNGHRLFDPFHVRDYQNIFSAVDSRAIKGVEVYTGGFPVRFGDQMSGLVLMESLDSEKPRHTEIGLSVYNTSVLTSGRNGDSRWLFSARRGNLDLVLNPKLGEPSYYDVFAQFEYDLTPSMTFSANALYADDLVSVVLESDPAEREVADSNTRNAQLWLQLDNRWSTRLSSSTAFSIIAYSNRRLGSLNDFEKIVGSVSDIRSVDEVEFRQDFVFRPSDHHLMQWGFSFTNSEATYDYVGEAQYFGIQALYENRPNSISRNISARPDGGTYALYVADRWKLAPKTVVEWGLRWDDQTYTDLPSDSQLSPRISVLRNINDKTELRVSWGRYHQSQGIHELQIGDGITNFWPAQRADHLIVGVTHRLGNSISLRAEAFHKDMREVRTRFENLYDPLGLIPELQADRIRIDPARSKSLGLELSAHGSHGPWSWWASYTLSEVTDRINGKDVPRSWDQRHALQSGLRWADRGWDITLAASTHTGWPSTDLGLFERGVDANGAPIFVAIPGARNAQEHPSFVSVDFRIGRKFNVPRGSLSAFFEMSNALDRKNECCLDWDVVNDGAGNLTLDNSLDYWLPMLPAVGILWEF